SATGQDSDQCRSGPSPCAYLCCGQFCLLRRRILVSHSYLYKFVLTLALFVGGLCPWSSEHVLAQGALNGLPQRVSTLETRADGHEIQIAELRSGVITLAAQTAASLKYIGGVGRDIRMEPTPTLISDGRSEYLSD